MEDNSILNIFDSFDLIIYTDDYKLRNRNCTDLFGFFTRKKYISESDLPGIAFISVDVIQYLKSIIDNHNKELQDSEKEPNENTLLFVNTHCVHRRGDAEENYARDSIHFYSRENPFD